ncbi:MAG TPA: DNA-binding protein [Clostridia bacterium]|nr:DNA-binding protein [Clostridia bacterium]
MEHMTVKEAGEKWAITGRMVTSYCGAGRIKGAIKKGNLLLVPSAAEKPVDGSYKYNKTKDGEGI